MSENTKRNLGLEPKKANNDAFESIDLGIDKEQVLEDTIKNKKPLLDSLKVNANENNFSLSDSKGLTGIEYSKEYGPIFNVGVQINKDNTQSFLLQGSVGEKEKRVLAGAGFKVGKDGMLSVMGEYLNQDREDRGEKFDVTQHKIGVNFKLKSFDIGGSFSKSQDETLQNKDVIINSNALWQKYSAGYKFEGQEATSAYVGNTFDITKNSDLRAALGVTNIDGESHLDAGLKYSIYMGENGKVYFNANRRGETTTYGGGYEGSFGDNGNTLTAGFKHIDGPNGYDDNRVEAKLNFPLSWGRKYPKKSRKSYNKPKYSSQTNVGDNLLNYVKSEKSYQVLGQVKETGKTLLAEIDKTGLPANAEVNEQTGIISVNGLNAFTALASITRDGAGYLGTGFSIQGNTTLLIDLSKMTQPTDATDIYVITTNGTPANTITVTVDKGSIKIRSIVVGTISPEVAPVMGNVPDTTITNGGGTTLDISTHVTATNGDPISTYTLTGALPAGLTFDSNTGTFSGTTTATGTYPLTVTATDNDGVSNSDAFNLEVLAPDLSTIAFFGAAPDTKSKAYTNMQLVFDGNIQSVSEITLPNGGTIVGTPTFTGDKITLNFTTPNSSPFIITTKVVGTNGNEVTLSTAPQPLPNSPNVAPTAADVTRDAAGGEVVVYDLAPDISDPESADGLLTINVLSGPTQGSLAWAGTQFTYTTTPASGYFGNDSFTYNVEDPQGLTSATRTVTITNIVEDGNP